MNELVELFRRLDRLGPGSVESLRWAVSLAQTPADATVLDAGCGTGADLPALLTVVPHGKLVAIDTAEAFVALVQKRFTKVQAEVANMLAPPGGPFDLIWSAGAVYNVGVEAALAAWRDQLKPGGRVAFSELSWRTDTPPPEAQRYFEQDGASPVEARILEARVEAAGWRVLGARWLGPAGWSSYYAPLEAAIDALAEETPLVKQLRHEISLWRTHGMSYGYRIIVCEPV